MMVILLLYLYVAACLRVLCSVRVFVCCGIHVRVCVNVHIAASAAPLDIVYVHVYVSVCQQNGDMNTIFDSNTALSIAQRLR